MVESSSFAFICMARIKISSSGLMRSSPALPSSFTPHARSKTSKTVSALAPHIFNALKYVINVCTLCVPLPASQAKSVASMIS